LKKKEFRILYEDNYLLVIDKPPNLLVTPISSKETTLTDILNKEYRPKNSDYKFYPCHRLDKEVSGVLIYAKGKDIQKKVAKEFQRRKNFTVVEVRTLTGRKNQIRRHFKMIGHPLVGESKFSFRRDFELKFKRVCLHAKSIEFRHPVTKKQIKIESDLPGDLKKFLESN